MIDNLRILGRLDKDLTLPEEKAKAFIFDSGIPRKDMAYLSSVSLPRIYSIYSKGESELKRVNQTTLIALASGYDKLIEEINSLSE